VRAPRHPLDPPVDRRQREDSGPHRTSPEPRRRPPSPVSASSSLRPSRLIAPSSHPRSPHATGPLGPHRRPPESPGHHLTPPLPTTEPPPRRRPRSSELHPRDPARRLPGASPVLTGNLSSAGHSHAAGTRPLSPLDRAARPRPKWLFGRPRLAGRHVARAKARAGSRPSTVCELKSVSELVK
jgi:hypothetical protein